MNNNLTELIFIIDASGSMYFLTDDTIGGFNSLIEQQKNKGGECNVTTVLFNDHQRTIHNRVNIKDMEPLTRNTYAASGSTALYDAVGFTIDRIGKILSDTPEEERPGKVVVVITTDGYENASDEYTHEQIRSKIELQQNTYSWTFIFLGANINAESTGDSLGIKSGYSKTYTNTSKGVDSVYKAVSISLDSLSPQSAHTSEEIDDIIAKNLSFVQ